MKQIVIMPGGFHPFHAGHYALYKSALENFPNADVFAVGGYTNIGIYSSVFPRIDWYLQHDAEYHASLRGGWPGQDSGLRNEYLLRWHLYNSGVRWESYPNTLPHADGHIIR